MEIPILFNQAMVQAIIRGDKTHTRRPVKASKKLLSDWHYPGSEIRTIHDIPFYGMCDGKGYERLGGWLFAGDQGIDFIKSPFGKVGDTLYVRETVCRYHTINSVRKFSGASFDQVSDGMIGYRADGFDSISDFKEHVKLTYDDNFEGIEVLGDKWIPSIHMPKSYSRIKLKVKRVWVERVQDISEDDCIKEGVKKLKGGYWMNYNPEWTQFQISAKGSFCSLWDSIYKNKDESKDKISWAKNPFVWGCEFEVVK